MANQSHVKKLDEGFSAWNKWRKEHPEISPDLRNANLRNRALAQIDFRRTNLDGADLSNANLCSAQLDNASLYRTDLSGAKLKNAVLHKTAFKETILYHANFHKAILLDTLFLNVDLSEAINLENIFHLGPSTIGIDTFQRSRGKIPDVFLHEVGVQEQLLTSIRASGIAPMDYYSCFISYSNQNQHFVEILYKDLSKEGVLCWYAPKSLNAGDKFRAHIMEAVQSREKVLVVLSKDSLKSDWVMREVELARHRERNEKTVLLPIRLDNAILTTKVNWAVAIPNKLHIMSFKNWQHPPKYQKMLKDLLKALHKIGK